MKFSIFKGKNGEWYWNAQVSGNIIFSGGEGFEKPQKIVQTLRKNVIREDVKLEAALVKALKVAGLNEKGGQAKATKATLIQPLQELGPESAWPFPVVEK